MSRPSQAFPVRAAIAIAACLALHAATAAPAFAQAAVKPAPAKPAAPNLARPAPGDPVQQRAYATCLGLVGRDNAGALAMANDWAAKNGGAPADHCAGLALVELGRLAEAATRLEAAAGRAPRPDLAADLLAQAGNVWMMEGSLNKAYGAFTRSLGALPGQPRVLIDRARSLGAQEDWAAAAKDLDQAVSLAPSDPEARMLRAGARRHLNDLPGARADADAALAIRSTDADALLERGAIRRLSGDDAGAREDWSAVLRYAPGSSAANAARANLEALDVKVE